MRILTEEDLSSIRYFYEEKDDVTRYCSWEEIEPLVEEQFPEVIKAMKDLTIARKTLDILIRNMEI